MNKFILIVSLVFASSSFAQGVPAQAKELQKLVGSWKGSPTLTLPDGKSFSAPTTYDCKATSQGFGVTCKLIATMPDGNKYESTDVWGYSTGDGLLHWFTVTSAGETHDHKLTLDGNVLVGQFAGPQEGKLYVENVRFEFNSDKKISFRSSVTLGGKQHETFEGVLSK
jgi:hypothetical protein